jgi:hypothetical protein
MALSENLTKTLRVQLVLILGKLKRMRESSELPIASKPLIKISGLNAWGISNIDEVNYRSICIKLCYAAEKLEAFRDFSKALKADPLLGPQIDKIIGTTEIEAYIRDVDFLQLFSWFYLRVNPEDMELRDERFGRICNEVECLFSKNTFRQEYWAIIENLYTDVENEEIKDGIRLQRLSWSDLEKVWNDNPLIQPFYTGQTTPFNKLTQIRSILKIIVDEPKIIAARGNSIANFEKAAIIQVKTQLERAITAIRLLKTGSIRLGPIIHKYLPIFSGERLSHNGPVSTIAPLFECHLLTNELDELRDIYTSLKMIDPLSNTFRIGIGRFNMAVERANYEDALLDSMISCESFLLNDIKERGELQFRLALRTAHLLGTTPEEKREIFSLAKTAYNLRSKIAHGNILSDRDKEYLPGAINLCRLVAKNIILMNKSGKVLRWDEMIFN